MNNQSYLILFWMLASCGMPVSSLYQDKTVSVISAEKKEWIGGRAGVKGVIYTVKLKKKNKSSSITVKSLKAEGNTIPFVQNNIDSIIIISGNLPHENDDIKTADQMPAGAPIDNPVPQKLNPKDNWIEYTVKGSQILHRIGFQKFVSVESSEEPAP